MQLILNSAQRTNLTSANLSIAYFDLIPNFTRFKFCQLRCFAMADFDQSTSVIFIRIPQLQSNSTTPNSQFLSTLYVTVNQTTPLIQDWNKLRQEVSSFMNGSVLEVDLFNDDFTPSLTSSQYTIILDFEEKSSIN